MKKTTFKRPNYRNNRMYKLEEASRILGCSNQFIFKIIDGARLTYLFPECIDADEILWDINYQSPENIFEDQKMETYPALISLKVIYWLKFLLTKKPNKYSSEIEKLKSDYELEHFNGDRKLANQFYSLGSVEIKRRNFYSIRSLFHLKYFLSSGISDLDPAICFGKYRGHVLSDIPDSYLDWAMSEQD